jgi:5'-nucleotidase
LPARFFHVGSSDVLEGDNAVLKGLGAICVAAALLVGCGSDKKDAGEAASTTVAPTTTTTVAEPLRVLVTNDDGVGADGIDALVESLRKLPNTEVTVVAPAKNQSGSGGKTTPGALTATDAKTKSGYAAKAVDGFPADSVIWALDQDGISERPHVVLSGINEGQNVGLLVDISGTVGAARAAATRGIPALASSQGLAEPLDYPSGVKAVLTWLEEHRAELLARDTASTKPATVTNMNIPTCPTGTPKPAIKVPADTTGAAMGTVDCTTPYENPKHDIDGFVHGYVVQTDNLPLQPAG